MAKVSMAYGMIAGVILLMYAIGWQATFWLLFGLAMLGAIASGAARH